MYASNCDVVPAKAVTHTPQYRNMDPGSGLPRPGRQLYLPRPADAFVGEAMARDMVRTIDVTEIDEDRPLHHSRA